MGDTTLTGGRKKRRLSFKSLLSLFGSIIAIVSVVYVGIQLRQNADDVDLASLGTQTWLSIGILAVIYGGAISSLSFAWGFLLRHLQLSVSWLWVVRIYGLSQLAKYLPGNIFQMAGRQVMGQADGLPAGPLAKSTVLELSLLALVGALFSVLLLPIVNTDPASPLANILASLLFLGLVAGFVFFVHRLLGHSVAKTVMIYAVFLVLTGVIFFFTLRFIVPEVTIILLPVIVGSYVIAWLIGLITPGAPAGVGVREVVLSMLLSTRFDSSTILTAVVLGRIISVGGDLLFFFASLGLLWRDQG